MMRHLQACLGCCLLALALSGCGFQLKGSTNGTVSSLTGQAVRLISSQPRSELTAAVGQQLKLAGAQLTNSLDDSVLIKLGVEQFEQRNLSLTAQARSAEVEVTMTTRITLVRGNRTLIDHDAASVVRQFLNDPSNVVGKTEELRLLRDEMRRDLAAQIVRRAGYTLNN
jgi:LPS-assembly lipoprotein